MKIGLVLAVLFALTGCQHTAKGLGAECAPDPMGFPPYTVPAPQLVK